MTVDEQEDQEIPSSAEHLAAVIEGKASGGYSAMTKSLTARLPINSVALLDAMAAASKKSRTYILAELLEVGASQVMEHMSRSALKKLRQDQGRRASELWADATEDDE